jgi:hypothetical protein
VIGNSESAGDAGGEQRPARPDGDDQVAEEAAGEVAGPGGGADQDGDDG